MTALIIAFVLCLLLSSLAFALVSQGWFRTLRTPLPAAVPDDVTVIVAAHNERDRLHHLMEALNTQDYPLERIQVILADDRSNDNTAEVAHTHAGSLRLNVVRINSVPDGMSPKKHALHTAILAAKTDILLFTDADCRPEHGWISGMLRVFASGADAVIAPAPLDHGGSFASRYAAYESCRTGAYMTAAGAFNLPYMASGRSWGYRKALYERCEGLPGIGGWLGGDDDLLLQQFVSHGARIASCTEAGTMVRSDAPPDLPRLYRQKLRHYSVSVAYRGKAALLLGIFTGAQVLVLPIAALISILYLFEGNFFYAFLPAAGVLWMLHYNAGFMMPILRRLGLKLSRPTVAGLECFHVVFSALVGLTSFVKPHRW